MSITEGTAPGAGVGGTGGCLAGLAVAGVLVATVAVWAAAVAAPPPCPTDAGCSPTPWAPVALGLAMAVPLIILLHPWTAAMLAAGAALAWWQADRSLVVPEWGLPWALALPPLTLVVTVVLAVAIHDMKWGDPSWPPAAPVRWHARPPEPGAGPWVARRMAGCAVVLLLGAGGAAAWAIAAQRAAEDWRATAAVVGATIVANNRQEDRLTARLDNGTEAVVMLLDSSPYPVGSRQLFYVDGSRIVSPVREPVNHTWWLFWSALVGALGLMLAVRAVAHNLAVRRLFRRVQPVRAVQYVDDGAGIHVLLESGRYEPRAAEVRLLRIPVADRMPYRPTNVGVRPIWPVDFPTEVDLTRARPAHLYGHPGHWRWCVLVDGPRIVVPRAPAELVHWTPPAQGSVPEAAPAAVDPPISGALAEPDRSPPRDTPRTHRAGHAFAYAFAAGVGLVAGFAHWEITSLIAFVDPGLTLVTLWALVGFGVRYVWRRWMVSRAAWNDAGIAVTTPSGVRYLPWEDVEAIDAEWGAVRLRARTDTIEVRARHSVRWWPVRGERNAAALAAALNDARRRSLTTLAAFRPEVPRLVYPLWPMRLWALWLGETAAVFALTQLVLGLPSGRG